MRLSRVSFVALLLFASAAHGLDPANALTQYGHTAWRVRDGYFAGPLTTVAQTVDGFLWIGTNAGLIRFDGVRFVPWEPPPGAHLPDERIISLLGARDGSLWIGTASGVARWRGSKLTVYAQVGRFGALLEDRRGAIWMGHTRSLTELPPLCRLEREQFRCFRFKAEDRLSYVGTLYEDPQGDVWIGGEAGVCRFRPEGLDCHPIAALDPLAGKSGVWSLASDSAGTLWAGAGTAGVWRLAAGRWTGYPEPPAPAVDTSTLLADREGGLWIGPEEGGLLRRIQGRTERFSRADGLSGDSVASLFEDREGSVWVATASGLDRFRDVKVATLTPREGLPGGYFETVTAARDGGVWVAERHILLHVDKAGISSYAGGQGLPGSSLTSMLEDSRGRLWIGVDNGLAWRENGRFFRFAMPDGSVLGIVRSMVEDRTGDLWAATTMPDHTLVHIREGRLVEAFSAARLGGRSTRLLAVDPEGGLWIAFDNGDLQLYRDGRFASYGNLGDPKFRLIRSLHADSRGLWVATNRELTLIRQARRDTFAVQNGLPCKDIETLLPGEAGSLWLKTICGLVEVSSGELDAWMAHPERHIELRVLDAFDGVQSGLSPFSPRAARSADGRLWFTIEGGGLQVLDPRKLHAKTLPPPVRILALVADRRTYEPAPRLRLPALTREVEIDYTALSLAVPEKVRFRYRLSGVDTGWQDAATRRQAFYTNLGPGTYRFRVVASDPDGVWNEPGAALSFAIRPAFYQTRTFLALAVAAFLGLAAWAYRWRVRQVRASLGRAFEERLAERTRIAQELHDTLLQGFLSASLQLHAAADELPAEAPVKPRLSHILQLMRQVIDEGRNALRGLRSQGTSDDDIAEALARTRQELGIPETVGFRVVVSGRVRPLSPLVRDEVYRIGREALVNAFRHSGAANVEVEIEYAARALRVLVRDDGCGIDPHVLRVGREGHWGLSGMRERAERLGARLNLWSRAGAGTEVELSVPARIAFARVDKKR